MVKVSISGFTKAEVEDGLPDLLNEFTHHPWLINPQAFWDDSIERLVIIVGDEVEEKLEDRTFDEISDCIIATLNFDKKIEFDIQRI